MARTASKSTTTRVAYSVPGLKRQDAVEVIQLLQDRLNALNDLALTLKHVHWNVVGPQFIGVHLMLDPQVDAVRAMVDDTAERIATLGGSPCGTPGALVAQRSWDDYALGRADTSEHLGALDLVYDEQFQWFVRAYLENAAGTLSTDGARTEKTAARSATRKASRRTARS
jgi:starvation-inducible DNA-binding protein